MYRSLKDGVPIDISHAGEPLGSSRTGTARVLLVLPCMLGDVRSYPLRYEPFLELGFRVVLYNPRGHGSSGGVYSFDDAITDLRGWLEQEGLLDAPLFGVGHSAGGTVLLSMADRGFRLERLALLAPVLDTEQSVRFKYENGTVKELVEAFRPRKGSAADLEKLLTTDAWIDGAAWTDGRMRDRLDEGVVDAERPELRVGTLMENIFHPGVDVRDALRRHGRKVDTLLPATDSWFPVEVTSDAVREAGGRVHVVAGARDHFFRGGFREVMDVLFPIARAVADENYEDRVLR